MPHGASLAFAEVLLALSLDDLERVERVRLVLNVIVVVVIVRVLRSVKYKLEQFSAAQNVSNVLGWSTNKYNKSNLLFVWSYDTFHFLSTVKMLNTLSLLFAG